jgi:hypothetical protein
MGTDWELVLGEIGWVGSGAGIGISELMIPREEELRPIQEHAVSRCKESVESHLVEPPGQDAREIATDEFLGWKGHGLPTVVARVFAAKGRMAGLY